jgi:hypothetical protein
MFLEAPKNVRRCHAFISEELDDIELFDFYRFVIVSQIRPKNLAQFPRQMCLSPDLTERNFIACEYLSDSVLSDHPSLDQESLDQ